MHLDNVSSSETFASLNFVYDSNGKNFQIVKILK